VTLMYKINDIIKLKYWYFTSLRFVKLPVLQSFLLLSLVAVGMIVTASPERGWIPVPFHRPSSVSS